MTVTIYIIYTVSSYSSSYCMYIIYANTRLKAYRHVYTCSMHTVFFKITHFISLHLHLHVHTCTVCGHICMYFIFHFFNKKNIYFNIYKSKNNYIYNYTVIHVHEMVPHVCMYISLYNYATTVTVTVTINCTTRI